MIYRNFSLPDCKALGSFLWGYMNSTRIAILSKQYIGPKGNYADEEEAY